jgi:protein phosphatase
MSDVTFKMTVATNVGLVRSNNEDNFIVCPDLSVKDNWYVPADPNEVISLGEHGCVMVVADGMGGMNAGEVASELAVNSIKESFAKIKDFSRIIDCSNHVEDFLKRSIVDADAVIKKRVKEDDSTSGMGTTVVVAWIVGEVAHIAWCGDSRAYMFNRNSGLSRLSKDHSYVQELVDAGQLDAELAFDHPNSNIITRSLGDSPNKARPDYVCKRMSTGDYLLLCTDGLCGLCRDEEILDIMMKEYPSLEDYRTELFNAAFEAGGYDNVTIALMECMSVKEFSLASTVAPSASKKRKAAKKVEEKPEAVEENTEAQTEVQETESKEKKSGGKGKIIAFILFLIIAAAAVYAYLQYADKAQPVVEPVEVEVVEPEVTEEAVEPVVDESAEVVEQAPAPAEESTEA